MSDNEDDNLVEVSGSSSEDPLSPFRLLDEQRTKNNYLFCKLLFFAFIIGNIFYYQISIINNVIIYNSSLPNSFWYSTEDIDDYLITIIMGSFICLIFGIILTMTLYCGYLAISDVANNFTKKNIISVLIHSFAIIFGFSILQSIVFIINKKFIFEVKFNVFSSYFIFYNYLILLCYFIGISIISIPKIYLIFTEKINSNDRSFLRYC